MLMDQLTVPAIDGVAATGRSAVAAHSKLSNFILMFDHPFYRAIL